MEAGADLDILAASVEILSVGWDYAIGFAKTAKRQNDQGNKKDNKPIIWPGIAFAHL
jgi:hypothetical protein